MTIVSADKDLAQLVTRRVNMLNVYTGERWGPEEVGLWGIRHPALSKTIPGVKAGVYCCILYTCILY